MPGRIDNHNDGRKLNMNFHTFGNNTNKVVIEQQKWIGEVSKWLKMEV